MPSALRAAAVCLLALAACRTPGPAAARDGERDIALPPWVAAAVVGSALRAQLPFADPRPEERGVPVLWLGDEVARFAFAGDRRAARPLASHRLHLLPGIAPAAELRPVLVAMPRGLVLRGRADISIDVGPGPVGARVSGTAPPCLWRAIDEALASVRDPDAVFACPANPDLALVRQQRLARAIAAAEAAGDLAASEALRRRSGRQPDVPVQVHAELGRIAADCGNVPEAHDHAWSALLASTDPRLRAQMAHELAALAARGDDADRWRSAARERMATDPRAAAALLHHARRLRPQPATDYQLASRAHALAAAPDRAGPDALLAREHAAAASKFATDAPSRGLGPAAPVPALAATPPR